MKGADEGFYIRGLAAYPAHVGIHGRLLNQRVAVLLAREDHDGQDRLGRFAQKLQDADAAESGHKEIQQQSVGSWGEFDHGLLTVGCRERLEAGFG